ncbi:MAG: distant relative of cell wall-associated hydrolase [Rhodoferax sp.]|nr:distant relative of cell wall-associated hydrolase [Rhodoferax sp.]
MIHPLCMGAIAITLSLAACATGVKTSETTGAPMLGFQNLALNPTNGGQLVGREALQPGDILLTADNGLNSSGIRLITLSPVSHAAVYLADQHVAEAVGAGIRRRAVADLVADEVTVVAFRHPGIRPEHIARMNTFVARHVGQKYNYVGVMLQAPFAIERRACELPLVPSLVRDFCLRGVAAVQLGLGRNDQFFCSQFILEAYRSAGLPLTDADPRLINPGDLLHMREGDVPSVRIHQALQYVGHLKAPPLTAQLAAASR